MRKKEANRIRQGFKDRKKETIYSPLRPETINRKNAKDRKKIRDFITSTNNVTFLANLILIY